MPSANDNNSQTARPTLTNAQVQRAHEIWMRKFEGAILTRQTNFKTPTINHLFRRTFDHFGKNVHYISVYARIILGTNYIAQPEKLVDDKLSELRTGVTRMLERVKVSFADAQLKEPTAEDPTGDLVSFNTSVQTAQIIIPQQRKLMEVMELADQFLVYIHSMWMAGEIPIDEKSKAELDTKKLLRQIIATSRSMRNNMRQRAAEIAKTADESAASQIKEALSEDDQLNSAEAHDGEGEGEDASVLNGQPETTAEAA